MSYRVDSEKLNDDAENNTPVASTGSNKFTQHNTTKKFQNFEIKLLFKYQIRCTCSMLMRG